MTQEALKLAEDYAHMRAIWYVESLYGTSASHTELREKVMLGAHQALKEALAQTQEPVALETLLKWDDDIDDIDPIGEVVGFIEGSPYIMVKVHKGKQVSLDDDLYATPPQRNEQCNYPDCKCPTENPCLKKLAQPEQEPVAKYSDIVSDGGLDPRNTTPPQRTWVGLTDEEITALKHNGERYISSQDFARAVEAKLKQKNGFAEEKNT